MSKNYFLTCKYLLSSNLENGKYFIVMIEFRRDLYFIQICDT